MGKPFLFDTLAELQNVVRLSVEGVGLEILLSELNVSNSQSVDCTF